MNTKKMMLTISLILSGMNIFSTLVGNTLTKNPNYDKNINQLKTTGSCPKCNFVYYDEKSNIPINYKDSTFNDALAAARKLNTPIHLPGAYLFGLDLSNLDLSYVNLKGAILVSTNVTGTNFTHALVDSKTNFISSNITPKQKDSLITITPKNPIKIKITLPSNVGQSQYSVYFNTCSSVDMDNICKEWNDGPGQITSDDDQNNYSLPDTTMYYKYFIALQKSDPHHASDPSPTPNPIGNTIGSEFIGKKTWVFSSSGRTNTIS